MPAAPLDAVAEAIEALCAIDPSELSAGEEVVRLEALLGRLEAVTARAVGRFAAGGAWASDGALSATAWLTTRTRRPQREVTAQLGLARALERLPKLAEGALSGRVGTAQVRLVASVVSPATEEGVRSAEAFLCEQAATETYRSFAKVVAYLAQVLDPDGCEASAEARRAKRDVFLAAGFEGFVSGEVRNLDPIGGAIVRSELERLARRAYEADLDEARRRLAREPVTGELARSSAQRRADALVEMARRSAACDDDARLPAPLVSVLVDFPTLSGRICELADGTVLTPGSVLAYLDAALVERAVYKGPTRVEVGARTRLFSGATRRAVELRDRQCQHPCCERPFEACEVDHVVPFSEGGETTQANGRVLCGRHNRLRVTRPDLPDPPWPPMAHPPGPAFPFGPAG